MGDSRNRRVSRRITSMVLAGTLAAALSQAAEQRTGTHLESRAALPAIIQLNESGEINEILALIEQGRNGDAVALASAYVDRLEDPQLEDRVTLAARRYFAVNALCIALMASGRMDDAVEQCSLAISLAPGQWAAWNSRGTTNFARQDFEAALADFEQARALVPRGLEASAAIDRNIELTRARLAPDE